MSVYALRLRGVRKRYGTTLALDGLDLDVPRGALLGLIGPNGAGKTTTFGIVSGAIRADEGSIDLFGLGPFDPRSARGVLGMLPQDCELNPHSSARELLTFFARLGGSTRQGARKEADRVLELVRLSDRANARVGQLSHGMRRRLAVAQALLGDPELVLLDEPTGGLDPHLVVDMRDVLSAQRGQRTLVISSHILADLEAVCDHVAFIEAGRTVRSGAITEVTGRASLVRVRFEGTIDRERLARDLAREFRIERDELLFALSPSEQPAAANAQIVPALIACGIRVLEVRLGESLEAVYMATRR